MRKGLKVKEKLKVNLNGFLHHFIHFFKKWSKNILWYFKKTRAKILNRFLLHFFLKSGKSGKIDFINITL